jgi:hypothetical protein
LNPQLSESDVRILALEQLDAGSLVEHPDPHFLTAFAEQALSTAEEKGTLEHVC